MFSIRSIEDIFKTNRTLCNLLRPSLDLLSIHTPVDTGTGELEYPDHVPNKNFNAKPNVFVKDRGSSGHKLDTMDSASAELASHKLKQLSSRFYI